MTTTNATEKKTVSRGTETTERHQVTTTPSDTLVERTLGEGGLWLLRLLLVLLAAFLAGAAVQRIMLGNFAFKTPWGEVPPLTESGPESGKLSPVPPTVSEAFQVKPAVVTLEVEESFRMPASEELKVKRREVEPVGITSSSYVMDLLTQIQGEGGSDYALIDIGSGRNWLTTRLFIFAVLLRRMRSLKTFVFVGARDGIDNRYLGVVPPDTLRWLLAREYPWLEDAFAEAYSTIPDRAIRSEFGALEPSTAGHLVQSFLSNEKIQASDHRADDEWVMLSGQRWEHGRWINRTLLERVFDLSPLHSSVVEVGDLTPQERTLAVLSCETPFVALIEADGRFKGLVDRQALLERVAARLTSAGTLATIRARGA